MMMYPLTHFPAQQNTAQSRLHPDRILAIGAGVTTWSQQMMRANRQLSITTITWPPPVLTAIDPLLTIMPPPQETFSLVHIQFLNLLLPMAQWPAVITELVDRTAANGWIEFVDAGIINTFLPTSALAAIEAMTMLYADALHIDRFMPERVSALLAQNPGVVTTTIATTNGWVPLGNGPDPRGNEIAAVWLEQRIPLFASFVHFGLLPGGERGAAALARAARAECRSLKQQISWRITTTHAQIAPAWHSEPGPGRYW